MIRLSEIKLTLAQAEHPDPVLLAAACRMLALPREQIAHVELFKRSFDARKADLVAVYIVDVTLADPAQEPQLLATLASNPHIGVTPDMTWHPPVSTPASQPLRPVVVGFGPCGIFAALVLAQMGFKPIVLERGKQVRERTRDTWGLWRQGVLVPESNVQFGEGGAGTFSDGKLWSQIKDPRHLGRKVMTEFVKAGAPPEILHVAHPHIGTFKLVKVVESMREQIIALGGEIRFQQRVTDLMIEDGPQGRHVRGLTLLDQATGEPGELRADHVRLICGATCQQLTWCCVWRKQLGGLAHAARCIASAAKNRQFVLDDRVIARARVRNLARAARDRHLQRARPPDSMSRLRLTRWPAPGKPPAPGTRWPAPGKPSRPAQLPARLSPRS